MRADQVLNKRYELVQRLGKGSFGVVLQALDTQNGMKPVAIKVSKGNSSFDRENTR